MPWQVYALMVAWLAFGGWWTWRQYAAHQKLASKYEEPDLIWQQLRGKLPHAQSRLLWRFLIGLFGSLALLALLLIVVMVASVT